MRIAAANAGTKNFVLKILINRPFYMLLVIKLQRLTAASMVVANTTLCAELEVYYLVVSRTH